MTCRVPLHMLRGAVGPQSARGKILTDAMRLFLALLIPALLLHGQSSTQTSLKDPPSGTDSVVLISLGLTDTISTVWDGSVQIQDGMLLALIGREFRVGDVIHSPNRWQASSRPGFVIAKRLMYEQYFSTPEELQILEPSFYAFLDSGPATQLTVDTEQGMFDIRVSDLAVGETKTYLGGRASAQRTVFPRLLGRATRGPDFVRRTDHDYPSVVIGSDGSLWASWQAYTHEGDEVHVQRGDGRREVIRSAGDVFRTDMAIDGDGRVWVVWSERLNDNWDLFGRAFDGEGWSPPKRLTDAPQPDLQHRLASGPDGSLHLVWQGYRRGTASVFHRSYAPEAGWSEEIRVSGEGGNCWEPAVVATDLGVFIAWDQYGENGYDIRLRHRGSETWNEEIPVAVTSRFEAHVAMTADPAGRVWLAWDQAGANWGKDFGYPRDITLPGEGLYQQRRIRMAVWEDGTLFEPGTQLADSFPADRHNFYELPELAAEGSGRVWAFFRHRTNYEVNDPARVPSHYALWEIYASYYEGGTWSPMTLIPYSSGNNDQRMRTALDPNGSVVAAWPTDRRNFRDFDTLQPDVFTARLPARTTAAPPPELKPYAPVPLEAPVVHRDEPGDLARIRRYEYVVDGNRYRIFRGDMHRHTEFSWDGQNDGSLQDAYRYAIDAAGFDYVAITEHIWGARHEYDWWRTQKAADLYRVGKTFVPLFGYERSVSYPNGHRNIIFAYRGVKEFDIQGHEIRPYGDHLHGAERLYAYLRRYNGIAMSHTSATNMGTDWRDWDPEVEPLVEIYQSDRNSYETVGGWRSADPDDLRTQHGGYQPAGMVSKAWESGIRVGVQASSDHMATHSSYAMILAEDNTRASLLEGIRARRAYGATDNIVLDFRLVGADSEHLMGEEVRLDGAPRFRIHAEGTAPIGELELVRNNEVILSRKPESDLTDLEFRDNDRPTGRTSFYYVRMRQSDQDKQIAWSSPIWVE